MKAEELVTKYAEEIRSLRARMAELRDAEKEFERESGVQDELDYPEDGGKLERMWEHLLDIGEVARREKATLREAVQADLGQLPDGLDRFLEYAKFLNMSFPEGTENPMDQYADLILQEQVDRAEREAGWDRNP